MNDCVFGNRSGICTDRSPSHELECSDGEIYHVGKDVQERDLQYIVGLQSFIDLETREALEYRFQQVVDSLCCF